MFEVDELFCNSDKVCEVNSKGCPIQVLTILEEIRNNILEIEDRIACCLFECNTKGAKILLEQKANTIIMLPLQVSNSIRPMKEGPRDRIIQIIAQFSQKAEDCLLFGTDGDLIQLLNSWGGKKSDLDKLITILSD